MRFSPDINSLGNALSQVGRAARRCSGTSRRPCWGFEKPSRAFSCERGDKIAVVHHSREKRGASVHLWAVRAIKALDCRGRLLESSNPLGGAV